MSTIFNENADIEYARLSKEADKAIAARDERGQLVRRAHGEGEVSAITFKKLLDGAAYAASTDVTRFHLCGVLLDCKDGTARAVATDGHRLVKMEAALPGFPDGTILIPATAVEDLKRACGRGVGRGKLTVVLSDNFLIAQGVGGETSVQLSVARFPPYEQVIPRTCDVEVEIDRLALLASARGAGEAVQLERFNDASELRLRHPDKAPDAFATLPATTRRWSSS